MRQIACASCGTTNRIPEDRDAGAANCGRCKAPLSSGAPADVSESAFGKCLHATQGIGLLVDVWAAWCGPCKAMAPHFARAAAVLEPNVKLLKVNADQAPTIMSEYGISGIPALLLFRDGRLIGQRSGALTADQIIDWTRQSLARAAS